MFVKYIKYYKLLLVIFFLFSFFSLQKVFAIPNLKDAYTDITLDKTADKAGYDVGRITLDPIIGAIIQATLSLLGIIFIILMIYGGGLWMTAKGNEQQVDKAKGLIIAAIIGLVIVVAAYAISYFVIQTIGKGSLNNL
jgi:TRAP-type C4-dicarboxylate transport system permease small subunit